MNAKAQLSIEFLFVILYFLLFIGFIFTISGNFTENQVKIHIKNQETKIAHSLSKIISATKGLEQGDSYSVEYKIPMIYIYGKLVEMPCEISVNANNIQVQVDYKGETITKNIRANLDNPNVPFNTKCGELMEISD